MGAGKKRSSSRSFFCGLFRFSGSSRRRSVDQEEPRTNRARVWASDQDRGRWVGEPDIDRKATEFIAKFHESHFTDTELQSIKS